MRPRLTGDLDIFIRPTAENAAKVVAVLTEFGFADLRVKSSDFLASEQVIQLGHPTGSIS
jgi:acyl-CoA hydrolase